MKKFLILGVLAIIYVVAPAAANAEGAADAIFCRQEEIVSVQIPQALEKDLLTDARGEDSGGDGAYFDLTDSLIAEGSCAQIPPTDVSFTSGGKTWCSAASPDTCFIYGAVVAKLPEEAGNHFVHGFAILPKAEVPQTAVVDVGKGDLEVAEHPAVLAATAP